MIATIPTAGPEEPLAPRGRAPWMTRLPVHAFGPGLVFALTVIGPGDIVSNAAAGAANGCSLLWVLVVAFAFRFVWVNTSAKYVLVTGESLFQGYARLGSWAVWLLLAALVVYRHAGNLGLVVILGSSFDLLLHLPTARSSAVWSLVFVALAFGLMFFGRYSAIERAFKVLAAVLSVTFAAAAAWSRPDLLAVVRGMAVPQLPAEGGVFMLMALVGTGSGSLTNLTYAYFIHRKGWQGVESLKRQRADLAFSVACMFVLSAVVQVAAAGALPRGARLGGLDEMAAVLSQAAGRAGVVVFALGLWAVALSVFVGASTGFALIVTDICRNVIPGMHGRVVTTRRAPEEDPIYRAAILFAVVSPLYVLLTGVRPVWLVLFVNALIFALVPFAAVGLLWMTNDRARLGRHANNWVTNFALALLIATAVALALQNLLSAS